MEIQALTRYARMSPKKVREVARTIQGRKAPEAVAVPGAHPAQVRPPIAKTLRSAIANAENNNNLSADTLVVKSAIVENGPVLKRFKAGARGTADAPPQEDVPHPHRPVRRRQQLIHHHGPKNQSDRFPPRRPPQLAVPLVREQEGLPQAPPRRPGHPHDADGEAEAGLGAAHLHRARVQPRPRQDLHRPPGHRHRPQGPGGREHQGCSSPS